MYFWILLLIVLMLGTNLFQKFSSNQVEESVDGYVVFLIVTGITASLFFWVVSGFRLQANVLTLVYSFFFAIVAFILNVFGLKVLQLASITDSNVARSAGSLVVTSMLGMLLFKEAVTLPVILRISIMLAATFLVFFDMKRKEKADGHSQNNVGAFVLVTAVTVAGTCAATLIMKFYANAGDKVKDNNSFFFFTNIFMIAGAGIWYIILQSKKRADKTGREAEKRLQFNRIGWVAILVFMGSTVASNATSLAELELVDLLDVSVYTPVTSAIGILAGGLSSLMCREKIGICSVLAMALSVVAVVI